MWYNRHLLRFRPEGGSKSGIKPYNVRSADIVPYPPGFGKGAEKSAMGDHGAFRGSAFELEGNQQTHQQDEGGGGHQDGGDGVDLKAAVRRLGGGLAVLGEWAA